MWPKERSNTMLPFGNMRQWYAPVYILIVAAFDSFTTVDNQSPNTTIDYTQKIKMILQCFFFYMIDNMKWT